MLLARTKRSQDAKPATYLMSPSPAPSPGTGEAAGAQPPLLHPFPQLALLGGPHPSPESHLPQLLHPLPVPGLQALQPPALQEALLGRLLALLQDLLLVLQLRAYPAPGGGLRRSCGGGGTQPSSAQRPKQGGQGMMWGLSHLLQVLTVPAPVLPSELLPASFVFPVLVPLIYLVLLLPLFIAGPGWVKGTCHDSPSPDSPLLDPPECLASLPRTLPSRDGSPGAGHNAAWLPAGPAPLPTSAIG